MAFSDASRQNMLDSESFTNDKHSEKPPWILHHILNSTISSELPLRIMFSLNARQAFPSLKQARQWWLHDRQGKLVSEFLTSIERASTRGLLTHETSTPQLCGDENEYRAAGDRFMDSGNDILLDVGKLLPPALEQTQGLPATFVQSFCLRIYAKKFADADWCLSLAGLDYLRDFECTRRTALQNAAERLGITTHNWREVLSKDPDVRSWIEQLQTQELRSEGLSAKIFVDIRIWTMVHQLKSTPFFKADTLAMLNTLFPPSTRGLPNDRMSPKILQKYRATFFEYIAAVETNGSKVMETFTEKLLRAGSRHSWQETRENLEIYLDLADCMIQQAKAVHSINFFRDNRSDHSRAQSDAQSSYSDRPTTASSKHTSFNEQPPVPSTAQVVFHIPDWGGDRVQPIPSRYRQASLRSEIEKSPFREESGSLKTPTNDPKEDAGSGSTLRHRTTSEVSAGNRLAENVQQESTSTASFIEKWSEAARHGSFSRPVTPLADPRVVLHRHRRTLSSPQVPPVLEAQHIPEAHEAAFSPELSIVPSNTVLPSDNFAFLQKPYEPPPASQLPSVHSFYSHSPSKKASSGTAIIRNDHKANGLGLHFKSAKSMENLPSYFDHADDEQPKPRRTLRSAISQTFHRTPEDLRPNSSGSVLDQENKTPRPPLRSKMSLPTLNKKKSFGSLAQSPSVAGVSFPTLKKKKSFASIVKTSSMPYPKISLPSLTKKKSFGTLSPSPTRLPSPVVVHSPTLSAIEEPWVDFKQTADEYERYTLEERPRVVKKKTSLYSLVPAPHSDRTITPTSLLNTPRPMPQLIPNKLYSPPPTEIPAGLLKLDKPPPRKLRSPSRVNFDETPERARGLEYSRAWFLRESRSKRYGMARPTEGRVEDGKEKKHDKSLSRIPRAVSGAATTFDTTVIHDKGQSWWKMGKTEVHK